MRYILVLCLVCAVAVTAESATVPVPAAATAAPIQLSNDQKYVDKLQAVLDARPNGKDTQVLYEWLWRYFLACLECRRYAEAEIAARAITAMVPQYALCHSNLSVALGKQGKYQEALQEAEIAKLLDPGDSMHADAVACSWMFYLGRKQEAIDRLQHIVIPTEQHAARAYWGCRACFYASVGTVEDIKLAIATAMKLDPSKNGFFERDANFDRYRAELWFIELVGKTLK